MTVFYSMNFLNACQFFVDDIPGKCGNYGFVARSMNNFNEVLKRGRIFPGTRVVCYNYPWFIQNFTNCMVFLAKPQTWLYQGMARTTRYIKGKLMVSWKYVKNWQTKASSGSFLSQATKQKSFPFHINLKDN